MPNQHTLKDSFSFSGKGLHTGLCVTVSFYPAEENSGYQIQRVDLEGQPVIQALAEYVTETTRGTVLVKDEVKVSTLEHALAALYAAGVDNCLMQVDGPEFPILDGSAICYAEAIERVGLKEQASARNYFEVHEKIGFYDKEKGISMEIFPDKEFSLNVLTAYDSKILYNQFASLESLSNFKEEIAAARTFVFVREIEPLLHAGLIKGGDLDNAIVIYEREMNQEQFDKLADVMGVAHMDASQLGYINHKPLVWDNEPARHKLLDVIGDLALLGRPLKGRVIATRPGHTVNNKFARLIKQKMTEQTNNQSNISPLAYVHPEAQIGRNVEIGAFAYIDKNVVIGDDNVIMPHANILYGSRIGKGNRIFPGAVIGAIPQDLKFRGEETTAEVGDNNTIRENVTINRGTAAKGRTVVGNNNLLMEGVHVAHDSLIGNGCIIGNSTKFAGEIVIDNNAIISANVLLHQFCRIGSYAMVQGGSRSNKDIPPYIIAAREPIAYYGINLVGLRRNGFTDEQIAHIHDAYRIIYSSGLNVTEALAQIREQLPLTPEIEYILSFVESSQRGIIR